MSRIVILHFGALEYYPPVQNFIRVLESKSNYQKIYVLTTCSNVNTLKKITSNSNKVKIIRFGISGQKLGVIKRYISYLLFYTGCILYLILKRPSAILYYETISSFPAYLYRRFFNSKVRLLIHYHEYTSIREYKEGMKLNRYFNVYEKYLYPIAEWVSHTNEYRMQKFIEDIAPVKLSNPRILPNYPPISWFRLPKQKNMLPIKVVYVGSLSMNTMYTKEFVEWVISQNGKIEFDIYSYNITTDVKMYLQALNSNWVSLKNGVDYDILPSILNLYDVGVILYNGHIDNYIYNAPNKLFEYLISGLDVWFPEVMKGSIPYITNKTLPKVISVNFTQLDILNLDETMFKEDCIINDSSYYSERELSAITVVLLGNS